MSLGSHFGYIIVSWLLNPSRGGTIFVAYVCSGLFFFLMFRMVYNCVDDRVTMKKTDNTDRSVELGDFADFRVERQLHDHRLATTHEFSYAALMVVLCSGALFALMEFYVLVAFILLPIGEAIRNPPEYLLTLFQVTFLVITVIVAYKYVIQEPPLDRAFLMSMIQNMRYYHNYRERTQDPAHQGDEEFDPPRQITEVEQASAVVGALAHNYLLMEEGHSGNNGTQRVKLTQIRFLKEETLHEERQSCLSALADSCWQRWRRPRRNGYEDLR